MIQTRHKDYAGHFYKRGLVFESTRRGAGTVTCRLDDRNQR